MNVYDGWITDKGKFLKEDFSHKETLTKNGYPWSSSDQAIGHGFTRLVDEGGTLTAEVKLSHFEIAKRWLENNVHNRDIEIHVITNQLYPKIIRIGGRL